MQRGGMNLQMMAPMTPMVKKLLIANLFIWFVVQVIIEGQFFSGQPFTLFFSFSPARLIESFNIWTPFTYMFLHATSPMHILMNMLVLWWFGGELEQKWGTRFFTLYYFVCGVGASLLYSLIVVIAMLAKASQPILWTAPVIGASGAIFGLLLAFGIIFGERVIYLFMTIPIKAKYFVMIIGMIEIVSSLNTGVSGASSTANLAHLGGLVTGFLFLIFWTRYKGQKKTKKPKRGGRKLKLVVNNDNKVRVEDDDDGGDGPRYWN